MTGCSGGLLTAYACFVRYLDGMHPPREYCNAVQLEETLILSQQVSHHLEPEQLKRSNAKLVQSSKAQHDLHGLRTSCGNFGGSKLGWLGLTREGMQLLSSSWKFEPRTLQAAGQLDGPI